MFTNLFSNSCVLCWHIHLTAAVLMSTFLCTDLRSRFHLAVVLLCSHVMPSVALPWPGFNHIFCACIQASFSFFFVTDTMVSFTWKFITSHSLVWNGWLDDPVRRICKWQLNLRVCQTAVIVLSLLGYWWQRPFTCTCRLLWRWQEWGQRKL